MNLFWHDWAGYIGVVLVLLAFPAVAGAQAARQRPDLPADEHASVRSA
jgi:hypothetical protein